MILSRKMIAPRVLIINGDPINNKTATGITLSSLFSDWEKDALAQIFTFPVEPDIRICARNWYVSRSRLPLRYLSRRIRQAVWNRAPIYTDVSPVLSHPIQDETRRQALLSAWVDTIPLSIPKGLLLWVEAFGPTLIYSNLGTIRIMSLAARLARLFNVPLVPHFMDDWPTTRYASGRGAAIPRRIMGARLRAILLQAPVGMVISAAMATEYRARYAVQYEAFMNCVDLPEPPPSAPLRDDARIRYCYAGGLHLSRWRSLLEIGKALSTLASEGLAAELWIFAPPDDLARYGRELSMVPSITIGGSLRSNEVMSTLRQFDVMVHIESFDGDDRLYTRYSISTKIPQYMAAGRPIIALCPVEAASCSYIRDSLCGLVVTSPDELELSAALRRMTLALDQRRTWGENGFRMATEHHNAVVERRRFRKLLATACNLAA